MFRPIISSLCVIFILLNVFIIEFNMLRAIYILSAQSTVAEKNGTRSMFVMWRHVIQ